MSGGRGGCSLMGGNDDSPTNSAKDENSYMEAREKKPIPVPSALIETISFRVCPKQRLGFNIRKRDNRVMRIHWSSPLHNKMCIGDKILKIDDVAFDMKLLLKAATPHKTINCSKESIVEEGHVPVIMKITIERAVYSWSRLEKTTLEQIEIQPKKSIFTGRPVKKYTVVMRRPRLPGIELAPIGLSLRYDSRERVAVAAVEAGSMASAHLRPWDIIKRVNGDEVRSKTMCAFMIIRSLKDSGQVVLTVEVLSNANYSHDSTEMPQDVVTICAKQIAVMKSGTPKPLPSIFIVRPQTTTPAVSPKKDSTPSATPSTSPAKNARSKRLSHEEGKSRVEEIVSDVAEGTVLKKSKFANLMHKK